MANKQVDELVRKINELEQLAAENDRMLRSEIESLERSSVTAGDRIRFSTELLKQMINDDDTGRRFETIVVVEIRTGEDGYKTIVLGRQP